ncbi:MAG: hypothetical protein V4550_03335 [Gemmatimonadota bacterium]
MPSPDQPRSDEPPRAEAGDDLPPAALQAFIVQHMPSLDHVAVLLAMRNAPDAAHQIAGLAVTTRLEAQVIERVARDLVSSGLLQRDGEMFRYAPVEEVRQTIDRLADMYHRKPVTLIRALYDRPARAVQSFADAFRVRKVGE